MRCRVRLAGLERALASLARDWGTWLVPWREINRLQRIDERVDQQFGDERRSIPVVAVGGQHGALFTYATRPVPGQKRRYGVAGGLSVSVVGFDPTVRRLAVHTIGASGIPSPRISSIRHRCTRAANSGRRGSRSRRSRRTSSGRV